MVVFPSAEWAEAFRTALNANPAYAESAKVWEGDILLLILPDPSHPHGEGVYLDLAQGACRGARYVSDAGGVQSEFVYQGSRSAWGRLIRGELDPVRAILDGTFQVKGNMAKALRFTRAAKELVETAGKIPATMASA
ncbi:MAG: SCP2 sterol-binding domain-containing protein [Thermoplasmata archaeon]|nr:SCP2 sterol-binding domain-containing protein [Thermoplasmata archaeon]